MTTITRSSLPEVIYRKGWRYVLDREATDAYIQSGPLQIKPAGAILVLVQNRRLKGKLNIHGKPYEPTKWVFIKTWRIS